MYLEKCSCSLFYLICPKRYYCIYIYIYVVVVSKQLELHTYPSVISQCNDADIHVHVGFARYVGDYLLTFVDEGPTSLHPLRICRCFWVVVSMYTFGPCMIVWILIFVEIRLFVRAFLSGHRDIQWIDRGILLKWPHKHYKICWVWVDIFSKSPAIVIDI